MTTSHRHRQRINEMKISWNKNIEPENKAEIEKFLDPLIDFIPAWCQELIVSLYSGNNTDASIETTVNYDYRRIELDFYSAWLLHNAEDRQLELLHEFIHFFICPLYYQAQRILENCSYANDAKNALLEELKITNESITQDLCFAIGNKFGNKN